MLNDASTRRLVLDRPSLSVLIDGHLHLGSPADTLTAYRVRGKWAAVLETAPKSV
jgi:hypothetical protein